MDDTLRDIASRLGFASQEQAAQELRTTVWSACQELLRIASAIGQARRGLEG